MELELDHVFVCVQPNAPEAQSLLNFGLQKQTRTIHQGQGTANICFFFHNAYLELLWLDDATAIQSSLVQPTHLWERCRWRETKVCPFGVSFRPVNSLSAKPPFSTWDYHAPFLPEGASIPIANNSDCLEEPLIFLSLVSKQPSAYPVEQKLRLKRSWELQTITAIEIVLPKEGSFSPEMKTLQSLGLIEIIRGEEYQMKLEFEGGLNCQMQSFEPNLPLSFCW